MATVPTERVPVAGGRNDYFTVVDDLQRVEDEPGADHIGETELTSGLFYGYVVLDRNMLLSNLGADVQMAGSVAEHLVHLIATVSPGAKLGSTAPYGYASWMLVEAGDCHPAVSPRLSAIRASRRSRRRNSGRPHTWLNSTPRTRPVSLGA